MKELEKAYEPKNYEQAIYEKWESSGLFNPDECVKQGVCTEDASSYTIVLPPPNVTGTLHMGHAAMLAIEDLMIRYHRMKGDKTLWLPGTDHAAVATESKVEKMLIDDGIDKPKETLGKDIFLEKVQTFAQESHDTIINQAKKMGASLDWSREAYTLDDVRNKAVRSVFKKMYDDGLIYRGYRVVNWSVAGQSTCSDDELVHVERPATLYTFKYSKECPIVIATTRPETKLGDTAIAVNKEGKWKEYIGQTFTIENFGQEGHTLTLHVISDEHVDDNFGTGALGVTSAHSQIDFEIYQRQKAQGNDIGLIQVIGEDGNMTANAGKEYVGLSTKQAQQKIVAWLDAQGLLEKTEDIIQNVGTSDRFKDIVEPLPKTQWFIDVNKSFPFPHSHIGSIKTGQHVSLKEVMQQVVRNKHITIVPDRFEKTYFHWIDNLRDWCISRQIWFGHQIPVWYKEEELYCDVEPPQGEGWVQDTDTLDTWFSAGLWTISTLLDANKTELNFDAWVAASKDVQTYHPTQVLETGYDILFFWVARMILMTTYAVGQIPFETVYLHGLVRDEQGRKMSKSLGNIINPLDMIDQYGTDATRLSLLVGGTPGNDMKLSEEKIAGFRNFTNKLWNICRFMLLNIHEPQKNIEEPQAHTLSDTWILSKLHQVVSDVSTDISAYRFSVAGEKLRDFTWNELADWYLEIAKIEGNKSDILNYILNSILKLWHPYMPFCTETIWQEVYGEDTVLMGEHWPKQRTEINSVEEFEVVKNIIVKLRALRAEYNIEPAKKISCVMKLTNHSAYVQENKIVFEGLARLESIQFKDKIEECSTLVGFVESGIEVYINLAGAVDIEKEKERIQKEIDHIVPFIVSLEKKLSNKAFVENAPEDIVIGEQKKLEDAKENVLKLTEQMNKLT